MAPRYLINEGGEPFEEDELEALALELDSLTTEQRTEFRNRNAEAIAKHPATRILIVAGPGTGKSTIFKQRVLFWLGQDTDAKILALSFVRKLVADLHADIQNDATLTDAHKNQVDVFTLHKYARSIVEQNHGTKEWEFAPHFRIIGQQWKGIVWGDVVSFAGQEDHNGHSWKEFETQLYKDEFGESAEWKELKKTYFTLCRFYNAAGFSDLILRARQALAENPDLNQHHCFIFDEYQDFNAAEEHLLENITDSADGTLIVGDDDQVLYETLKSGKASLIRAIYTRTDVVNAMLPFCGRCDFHITRTASHFIKRDADEECIEKICLPMTEPRGTKVQIVGCAQPSTAVDYIRKFIENHKGEIDQRRKHLAEGNCKDAFLLILSPSKRVDFYKPKGAREQLFDLIKPYQEERKEFSEDYYRILNYYVLARYPNDNFNFRKVLYHEGVEADDLLPLLQTCIAESKSFAALGTDVTNAALEKAETVRGILDSNRAVAEKVTALRECIKIEDPGLLLRGLEKSAIDQARAGAIEHQEEEEAELEEIAVKQMAAVELMTIVGSKGLSADHVIIIGFDNVNMGRITRNAFYVAMTRARRSLHIVAALKAGGAARPHEYLGDLPDENLEFSKYTKGNGTLTVFSGRRKLQTYLEMLARPMPRRG